MDENKFEWTETLINEYAERYRYHSGRYSIEDFIKLKLAPPPVKERIEVEISGTDVAGMATFIKPINRNHYIPQDKFPAIKLLIERFLNNEFRIHADQTWSVHSENQKTFTEKDKAALNEDTVVGSELLVAANEEILNLKKELEVTEKLLEERQSLLDNIPECPAHGKCVPHALAWIGKMKSKTDTAVEQLNITDSYWESIASHIIRDHKTLPEAGKYLKDQFEFLKTGTLFYNQLGENVDASLVNDKNTDFGKTYTQSEVDTMMEKIFKDGYFKGWYNGCFGKDKTMSLKILDTAFQDYRKEQSKPVTDTEQII